MSAFQPQPTDHQWLSATPGPARLAIGNIIAVDAQQLAVSPQQVLGLALRRRGAPTPLAERNSGVRIYEDPFIPCPRHNQFSAYVVMNPAIKWFNG